MKSTWVAVLLFLFAIPAWAFTPATGDTRVCMVGDSLTERGGWWRSYMADTRGTEWRYIGTRNGHDWRDTYYWHDGKSGDTSGEALARVATMKKQLVPFCQVVLLMIGGNDLLQKVPATTTVQNIQDIADSLAKEGAKVYIQTVLPVRINDHDSNIYWNTRIVLLNQKIKAEIDLKGGEYNHTILDTWKAFTDAGQGMGSSALDSLYTDGVHLSSWGYWILANFVRSVVP